MESFLTWHISFFVDGGGNDFVCDGGKVLLFSKVLK
jgi:hypothetical protein